MKTNKPFILTGYPPNDPMKKLLGAQMLKWVPGTIQGEGNEQRHSAWFFQLRNAPQAQRDYLALRLDKMDLHSLKAHTDRGETKLTGKWLIFNVTASFAV